MRNKTTWNKNITLPSSRTKRLESETESSFCFLPAILIVFKVSGLLFFSSSVLLRNKALRVTKSSWNTNTSAGSIPFQLDRPRLRGNSPCADFPLIATQAWLSLSVFGGVLLIWKYSVLDMFRHAYSHIIHPRQEKSETETFLLLCRKAYFYEVLFMRRSSSLLDFYKVSLKCF